MSATCFLSMAVVPSVVHAPAAGADASLPRISISSPSVHEGDVKTRNVQFLVSLSKKSAAPVMFTVTTSDGTAHGAARAAGPGDYVTKTFTKTILAGRLQQYVQVPVIGNLAVDGNRTFTLGFTAVSGADIEDASGTATILDDDATSGFRLGVGDVSVREGDESSRTLPVVVAFSAPAPAPFSVTLQTASGTALAAADTKHPAADYVTLNKTLAIRAGARGALFRVTLQSDLAIETDETFTVNLTSTLGLVTQATATVTIRDNATDVVRVTQLANSGTPAVQVTTDSAGNLILAGGTPGPISGAPETPAGGWDAYVVKLDSAGHQLWAHQFGQSGNDKAIGATVDSDDNVIVSGVFNGSSGSSQGTDIFVAKYDAGGTLQWIDVRPYVASSENRVRAALTDSAGNIFVPAILKFGSPSADPIVERYDADGNLLGVDHQDSLPADVFAAQSLAGTPGLPDVRFGTDGSIVSVANGAVTKRNASGTLLWTKTDSRFDGGDQRVSLDAAGNIAVSGPGNFINTPAMVTLLDPDGNELWTTTLTATWKKASPAPRTQAWMVGFAPNGDVVLVGTSQGTVTGAVETSLSPIGTSQVFVARYSSSGAQQWIHQLGGVFGNAAWSLTFGPTGNPIVTGFAGEVLPGGPTQSGYGVFAAEYTI